MTVQTALDLQSVLVERLQIDAKEFEQKFEVEKRGNKLILKIRRDGTGAFFWIGETSKYLITEYVKKCGGAWVPKESLWELPLSATLNSGFINISIDILMSLPFQVRSWGEDPTLAEMAETVKSPHGLLEPLVVRPRSDGNYEIVNGERRLKACKLAGLTEVPCVVKSMSDQEAYECQMIENIQRKDLSDIEKAHWLKHMLEKFPEAYPTQEALAKRIGKTQQYVSYHLALLKLPENFTTRVVKETGLPLTEGQARELLATPPEKREEVVEKVIEKVTPHKIEQPLPTMVACSLCGTGTSTPLMFNDKPFCCEEHLERAREAGKLKAPSARAIREMREPSLPEPPEREVTETNSKSVDTGFVFDCPVCHVTYHLLHLASGKHKFEEDKTA